MDAFIAVTGDDETNNNNGYNLFLNNSDNFSIKYIESSRPNHSFCEIPKGWGAVTKITMSIKGAYKR